MYRGWNSDVSVMQHILKRAREMQPSMRCAARTPEEFSAWHGEFKDKLNEILSPWPQRVATNARTISRIERENDFIEKFVIDVEHDLKAPGYILIPKDIKPGQKRPALLCPHGHGYGKATPAGVYGNQRKATDAYARLMTERGYVTIVIDSRGFGERQLQVQTNDSEVACNYLYLLYAMLGSQLITLDIHDQMQALDYLTSRDEVDPDRVGILGKSFGGTMAQYVGVFDDRLKAVAIVCYVASTLQYTFEDVNNNCGSQFVPGLYQYGDVGTVTGLIAPRPLLVQSGFADDCFPIDSTSKVHEEIRTIYAAAGESDKLTIDVFDGEHDFNPPTAYEFFDKWLGPAR